ncbi:MAG TPA: SRPBCC domain-containing protein [Mycobacteriales bacterium]|jgi:carbon monoxide dehydrogenase subunit G|nr:SRPBCC domain-containing protein [Mycobacteriales bacterium]
MRSSHDAQVAGPIDQVWASISDVDALLVAIPGASLSRDGDAVSGSLKCKLGSTQITYRLSARAEVGEPKFHTAVIAVTGKEARGDGTVAATLTVALRDEGATTKVEVSAEIEATGRAESADDAAWDRVISTLITAVMPPPGAEVVAEAESPARPPLTVAPPIDDSYRPPSAARIRMIAGAVGIVLVVLVRRAIHTRGGQHAGQ